MCHKWPVDRTRETSPNPNAHLDVFLFPCSAALPFPLALGSHKPTKMQSMLSLRATHGVPLCLSGIIHPIALSHEMADHDRRRKAVRRRRSLLARAREGLHANQEMGTHRNFSRRDFVDVEVKGDGDRDGDLNDIHLQGLTAKAA